LSSKIDPSQRIHIVIAEDDAEVCEMFTANLSSPETSVQSFANGRDAFNYICAHHVDIVISDFHMPGMNGLSVLARLKRNGRLPKMLFILCSGYLEEKDRAENYGPDLILDKLQAFKLAWPAVKKLFLTKKEGGSVGKLAI
jgi:CheY-like chemotaxis protein